MAGTTKSGNELKLTTKKLASPPSRKAKAEPEAPRPLSPKEKSVLEFLETYMATQGISPTYQEICQHFGFASFNSVQRYLKQLEAKGYIRLPWANQKRAITLLHSSAAIQSSVEDMRPPTLTPAIVPGENFALPLLGRVAAGAPIEAMEHDEFIDVPASLVRHADRTYALRVQGQSMIEDGILDGDVILVQRQTSANNGEIVVAVIGDEATVKRFYMHRGDESKSNSKSVQFDDADVDYDRPRSSGRMVELRPANSTMAPMWFDPNEVQIRGVVVGLIRRFF